MNCADTSYYSTFHALWIHHITVHPMNYGHILQYIPCIMNTSYQCTFHELCTHHITAHSMNYEHIISEYIPWIMDIILQYTPRMMDSSCCPINCGFIILQYIQRITSHELWTYHITWHLPLQWIHWFVRLRTQHLTISYDKTFIGYWNESQLNVLPSLDAPGCISEN